MPFVKKNLSSSDIVQSKKQNRPLAFSILTKLFANKGIGMLLETVIKMKTYGLWKLPTPQNPC